MTRANYSVKQLAERLQVSDKTIYGMIARGELTYFKFGRQIRISSGEVQRIECGSSNIAAIGPSPESTTASNGGGRFAPVIAPPPSGPLQTTAGPRRASLSRTR